MAFKLQRRQNGTVVRPTLAAFGGEDDGDSGSGDCGSGRHASAAPPAGAAMGLGYGSVAPRGSADDGTDAVSSGSAAGAAGAARLKAAGEAAARARDYAAALHAFGQVRPHPPPSSPRYAEGVRASGGAGRDRGAHVCPALAAVDAAGPGPPLAAPPPVVTPGCGVRL